jgi:hypothetical protein
MSGAQFDDPNRQAVGLEPAWAEGTGGSDTSAGGGGPPPENGDEGLPARHAPLDDLAKERGVEWSRDDLTVAEKQQELGG